MTSGQDAHSGWSYWISLLLSVRLDLSTGATMVCTFGLILIVMALLRPLLQRNGARARVPPGTDAVRG